MTRLCIIFSRDIYFDHLDFIKYQSACLAKAQCIYIYIYMYMCVCVCLRIYV